LIFPPKWSQKVVNQGLGPSSKDQGSNLWLSTMGLGYLPFHKIVDRYFPFCKVLEIQDLKFKPFLSLEMETKLKKTFMGLPHKYVNFIAQDIHFVIGI